MSKYLCKTLVPKNGEVVLRPGDQITGTELKKKKLDEAWLVQAGAIVPFNNADEAIEAVEKSGGDPSSVTPTTETDEQKALVAKVANAIKQMPKQADAPDHYGEDGKPRADKLSSMTGEEVTPEIRDAALAQV